MVLDLQYILFIAVRKSRITLDRPQCIAICSKDFSPKNCPTRSQPSDGENRSSSHRKVTSVSYDQIATTSRKSFTVLPKSSRVTK